MKRIVKKDATKFVSEMNDYFSLLCESAGSEENKILFRLNTKAGYLNVTLYKHRDHQQLYTVFSCFENEKEAKKICDCNPHSGKYNFHSFSPVDESIKQAKIFFNKILL